jgi:hypothetical protein
MRFGLATHWYSTAQFINSHAIKEVEISCCKRYLVAGAYKWQLTFALHNSVSKAMRE